MWGQISSMAIDSISLSGMDVFRRRPPILRNQARGEL
jgi:hypothetical protein